ncbi:hydantoinase B/oxoprolinase family protein [Acrocarpospora sp. B8E8]|uniref:hydantoinase B/oxoprolinase family protein n=1 Tax=Acrocarpospora sp. B8E8 TaxID=3153572 RepID=UPI00325C8B50
MTITTSGVDLVAAELHRKALEHLTEEMATAMVRTSGSPIVYEAKDFCTSLFDAVPEQLGFSGYVLMHLASSLGGVRAINDVVDMDALRPGDAFLTNDPRFGGAMHQADVATITPMFYRDELVGWSFSNMHVLDIGGVGVSGFAPGAHDVFEEGLRFPPIKVIRNGRLDSEWERFIAANVRTPDPVLNDIRGMIAANTGVAAERLTAIIDEFGLDTFRELNLVNKALSEKVMRQRVARMPDGVYRVTDWHEFDGHEGPDHLLEVTGTMTVSGSDLRFDFTGAPQVGAFVNSAPAAMEANIMDAVMTMMVYGDFPVNAGLWRPVTISVGEPGTVVNSIDPAPCSNAHAEIGTRACKITRALLAQAFSLSDDRELRGRVAGQNHDGFAGAALFGGNQHGGVSVMFYTDNASGAGGAAQSIGDGLDAYGATAQTGCGIGEVETHESLDPILMLWRRVVPNSGGPGYHRGGQGLEQAWELRFSDGVAGPAFNSSAEIPARGFGGGYPGASSNHAPLDDHHAARAIAEGKAPKLEAIGGTQRRVRSAIGRMRVGRGDVEVWTSGGGGGLGDPLLRPAHRVEQDVRDGYITTRHAEAAYGVVVGPDNGCDAEATARTRAEVREARIGRAPTAEQGVPADVGIAVVQAGADWGCGYCGATLAPSAENWRTAGSVVLRETPVHERFRELDMYVKERLEEPVVNMREYFCGSCAGALTVDVGIAGSPPDTQPELA